MRSVLRALLTMLLAIAAVPLVVTSVHAVITDDGSTYVAMFSDPRQPTGSGSNYLWRESDATISVKPLGDGQDSGATHRGVGITVTRGSGSPTDFGFVAPVGQTLTPGTYGDTDSVNVPDDSYGMSVHDGSDCYTPVDSTPGSFTVHDIAPDLSHFWISYVEYCTKGPSSAVFGEIRYHEPQSTGSALVAEPGAVQWPSTYRGYAAHHVTVAFLNRSAQPVDVRSARITSGSSEFSLVTNDCSRVPPGALCHVRLAFRPLAGGTRRGTLSLVDAHGATTTLPLSGDGFAGYESIRIHGEPGNAVESGRTIEFNPTNSDLEVKGDAQLIRISVEHDYPHFYSLEFGAADGQRLAAGMTVLDADEYSYPQNLPYISVGGDAEGCSHALGAFHIDRLTFDAGGEVDSLSMTFEQRCDERWSPATFGSIAWRSPTAPRPVPTRAFGRRPTLVSMTSDGVRVPVGSVVTLSGQIKDVDAAQRLPGRRIAIDRRRYDSSEWQHLTTVTSDSAGRFSTRARTAGDVSYRATYAGASDSLPMTSKPTVVHEPDLQLESVVTRVGHARVTCTLRPSGSATRLDLIKIISGNEEVFWSKPVPADGVVSYNIAESDQPDSTEYRCQTEPASGFPLVRTHDGFVSFR